MSIKLATYRTYKIKYLKLSRINNQKRKKQYQPKLRLLVIMTDVVLNAAKKSKSCALHLYSMLFIALLYYFGIKQQLMLNYVNHGKKEQLYETLKKALLINISFKGRMKINRDSQYC